MSAGGEIERPESPSPEKLLPEGVARRFDDGALRVSLPVEVYGLDAIFRSCYWLTEHCFVYLGRPTASTVEVTLVAKSGRQINTDQLTWDFLNDLVDQHLRVQIQGETRSIREMIVAQAFAEVDLIDDRGKAVDASVPKQLGDDPKGIRAWRPAS
jgi:His-Xaa-Ser system protein HxsD